MTMDFFAKSRLGFYAVVACSLRIAARRLAKHGARIGGLRLVHFSGKQPTAGLALVLLIPILLSGCARKATVNLREIPSPTPDGSLDPNLTAGDGGLLLSWVEPADQGARVLKFARRTPQGWSAPITVYQGSRREDSPSEAPTVVASGSGRIDAAWTEVSRDSPTEYQEDVFTSTSRDAGETWSHPELVNQDHTVSEHGYAALAPSGGQAPAVVWLDGRDDKLQHRYRLMTATVGAPADQQKILDEDVCTCCPTALVRTTHNLVAAYRDHTADNIRDISVVRAVNGQWTSPTDISHDHWRLAGCPTNGPALATDGKRVALAWYTAAADQPLVKVSVSTDEGATWSEPTLVSERPAMGRPSVALFPDGSALVAWVSVSNRSDPALLARRLAKDGTLGPILGVGHATSIHGRIKLAATAGEMLMTWAEKGSAPSIHIASIQE
jgi:hypothetical protein